MIDNINPINRSLLLQGDTIFLAKFLLGKYLISNIQNKLIISKIVETEAYRAPEDKASHAYGNKLTNRTKTMFEKGGLSYVYLCYGLHNMINVVTGPKGMAHAILIRAVEPVDGIRHVADRRKIKNKKNYCNGPGKVGQALGITRLHNGIDLCNKLSPIWLGDALMVDNDQIITSPRIGVDYAEECALWEWRFYIKGKV